MGKEEEEEGRGTARKGRLDKEREVEELEKGGRVGERRRGVTVRNVKGSGMLPRKSLVIPKGEQ